ncbi:hypothetical protein D3C73_453310 [compost metagenome]
MQADLLHVVHEALMALHILQAKKARYLPGENNDRNPCRKPNRYGPRNKLDQHTEPEQPHQDENDPGHHPGQQQVLIAILHGNSEQNGDKRSRRPANLEL